MSEALQKIADMKAAAQANVDALVSLENDVKEMAKPAPAEDLQPKIDALAKERDQLREAIQAHIDDEKTDTAKLEQALKPVEAAPVPSVDAPKGDEPKAPDAPPEGQPGLPGDAVPPEQVKTDDVTPLPGA